jgi:AAA domain
LNVIVRKQPLEKVIGVLDGQGLFPVRILSVIQIDGHVPQSGRENLKGGHFHWFRVADIEIPRAALVSYYNDRLPLGKKPVAKPVVTPAPTEPAVAPAEVPAVFPVEAPAVIPAPAPAVAVASPPARNALADAGWSVRELRARLLKPSDTLVIKGVGSGANSRGYLNYGSAAVINAYAGAGKSTMLGGLGVNFAQGLPFLGQDPLKPRNVLILQNENDEDDEAELIDGAIRWSARQSGRSIEEVEAIVDKHLIIARRHWADHRPDERVDANNMGEVPKRIRAMVRAYRAQGWPVEVLCLDPLLGFWFNILDQAATQEWLVNHLSPVLREERLVAYITHHIPLREVGGGKRTAAQATYAGYGGIIVPGWARATINLAPSADDENIFEWSYAKRHRKLGSAVSKVWYLKQASEVSEDGRELIYWEECGQPTPPVTGKQLRAMGREQAKLDAAKEKEKKTFECLSRRVVSEMGDGIVKAGVLCEKDGHIQRVWGCKRVKAYEILDRMLAEGWLTAGEGGGYRAENRDKAF